MQRIASVVVLIAGIIVLVYGIQGTQSFASEVKEAFDGTPTDNSIWLLVLGAVLTLAGLLGFSKRGLPERS